MVLAINEFREFLSFYPTHQRADYAQFKLGMAHFYQMRGAGARPDRDARGDHGAADVRHDVSRQQADAGGREAAARGARSPERRRLPRRPTSTSRRRSFRPARSIASSRPEGRSGIQPRDAVYFYLGESLMKVKRRRRSAPLPRTARCRSSSRANTSSRRKKRIADSRRDQAKPSNRSMRMTRTFAVGASRCRAGRGARLAASAYAQSPPHGRRAISPRELACCARTPPRRTPPGTARHRRPGPRRATLFGRGDDAASSAPAPRRACSSARNTSSAASFRPFSAQHAGRRDALPDPHRRLDPHRRRQARRRRSPRSRTPATRDGGRLSGALRAAGRARRAALRTGAAGLRPTRAASCSATSGARLAAPGDVMLIDRGSDHGVRAGAALTIYRESAGGRRWPLASDRRSPTAAPGRLDSRRRSDRDAGSPETTTLRVDRSRRR